MTSLYKIQAHHRHILDDLDYLMNQPEDFTDEELEALNKALEINAAEFLVKADAYASAISEKLNRQAFLKSEAARLTAMAKREETTANRLHEAISKAMIQQGMTKADLEHFRLSFRNSEAVEVTVKASELPKEYQRVKIVIEADKDALKAALKANESIEGVSLVSRQNLQIK